MTLKRKLGIAAVLVVVVGGLIAVLRKPYLPFTVTFVRYEGSNTAILRIASESKSKMFYGADNGRVLIDDILDLRVTLSDDGPSRSPATNRLGAFESREVAVELTDTNLSSEVRVAYFGTPTRMGWLVYNLADKVGLQRDEPGYRRTRVPLPPRNPPLP